MLPHPGDLDHSTRAGHEAIPATILCCPIRGQHFPVTITCLQEYGRESVVYRWLDPDSPSQMQYGMRQAIRDFWTGEKDLIHVDHDMVFTWDSLRDLVNCDGDFCTCPSWYDETLITASLGFAKFSKELQQWVDMDHVFMMHDTCWDEADGMKGCYGAWWGFEHHLMEELKNHVEAPCVHKPVLNDHSFFGLHKKREPVLSIDRETPEGRAAMIKHLREKMGWSLPNEPA
jgi:hypothetical protein